MWELLVEGVLLLAAAMVLGTIAERLKQSAIVGYLLAGVLLGPNVLGVVGADGEPEQTAEPEQVQVEGIAEEGGGGVEDENENEDEDTGGAGVEEIAQLGVALLMFTIGLEFSYSKLKSLGATAVMSGTLQISLTAAVSGGFSLLLGLEPKVALAIGMICALSSTAVVLPVLQRRSEVDSVHGRFALGILLIQDAAVVPLVLLTSAMGGEDVSVLDILAKTAYSFVLVALFVAVCFMFAQWVMPHLLKFGTATRNRETPILFAMVAAMGSAAAANALGFSPALGAFIAAIFLGESVIATQLRSDIGPFKSVFVTLFFSSIGMFADPAWIASNIAVVLGVTAAILVGKPAVIWGVGKLMGLTHRHALAAGMCCAQIGVFSFVLAQVAVDGGVIGEEMFKLLVSVTIMTLFTTPYAVNLAPMLGVAAERGLRRVGLSKTPVREPIAAVEDDRQHVVIVGYGPAGRAVAEALKPHKTPVVVIDLNPASVLEARSQGMRAFVGDGTSPGLLQAVQLWRAAALVLTVPDHRMTTAAIVEARSICPTVAIVARARYHRYAELLESAGAHVVVDEEQEVGRELGERVVAPLIRGHDASEKSDVKSKKSDKTSDI
jgi:CPA2 family monovalent cation:H+ antiporter-2